LYGEGKVAPADIAALSERIGAAHAAVEHMRATGEVRGHLSKDGLPEQVLFTQLPYVAEGHRNNPRSIARLRQFGERVRGRVDAVVSFGIGGSFLGNQVLFDVTCGQRWNERSVEERQGYPKLYFSGNNMDPRRTQELMDRIQRDAQSRGKPEPYQVLAVVISKSGATLDTMSTFLVIYDALCRAAGIEVEVVAVTDPAEGESETLLHRLAREQGWTMFAVPDGVGGRFSIFSEVGLITGACIGFDIDAFLEGARGMDQACRSADIGENPALLLAVLKYIAAGTYGRHIEVFMPYSDDLKSTAEWYIQLLAESLGKRYDRAGNTVYYGRTPVVAVGTTDMHSQTQLHQDGPKDKIVQFVKIAKWRHDPVIPDVFPSEAYLSSISGITLSQALHAALDANAQALSQDDRLNCTIILPELNAYYLGQLLFLLALAVAYEGELANVDAFDQPGVEAYKRILGPRLKELKLM
jgi:glucose-6-phosphate isomerase